MMIRAKPITSVQYEWITRLHDELPNYLQTLALSDQPGRFLPCVKGSTKIGRQISLGYSTFALKLYFMLGLWQTLPPAEQLAWVKYLKSFQVNSQFFGEKLTRNAFIDLPQIRYLLAQIAWYRRLFNKIFYPTSLAYWQKVIIAETKQTIATLAQIGETSEQSYRQFPTTPEAVKNYLSGMDWTAPWGAGGQSSALVVFLKFEAPRFLEQRQVQELLDACAHVFQNLAHLNSGGYFNGHVPEQGQLINGAMKVLTALDWLEIPIHYPERLIDTCLTLLPAPDGCHLVDAIYVLYRCVQQTDYRKADIQTYCTQVLEMIRQHRLPDGGFSYYIGCSQTTYYGVPISLGLAESDIHGTCLLTWALIMILEILESNQFEWQVIRP